MVALRMLQFVLAGSVAGFVIIHAEPYVDRFADWFDEKFAEARKH